MEQLGACGGFLQFWGAAGGLPWPLRCERFPFGLIIKIHTKYVQSMKIKQIAMFFLQVGPSFIICHTYHIKEIKLQAYSNPKLYLKETENPFVNHSSRQFAIIWLM